MVERCSRVEVESIDYGWPQGSMHSTQSSLMALRGSKQRNLQTFDSRNVRTQGVESYGRATLCNEWAEREDM